MAETSATATRGQEGAIQTCSLQSWKRRVGYRHSIQIQGRAVGDDCSRRDVYRPKIRWCSLVRKPAP